MKAKSIQLNPDGTFPMKYAKKETTTTTFTASTRHYSDSDYIPPAKIPFKKHVADFLEMIAVAYGILAVVIFTTEYLVAPFLVWYFSLILK